MNTEFNVPNQSQTRVGYGVHAETPKTIVDRYQTLYSEAVNVKNWPAADFYRSEMEHYIMVTKVSELYPVSS